MLHEYSFKTRANMTIQEMYSEMKELGINATITYAMFGDLTYMIDFKNEEDSNFYQLASRIAKKHNVQCRIIEFIVCQ